MPPAARRQAGLAAVEISGARGCMRLWLYTVRLHKFAHLCLDRWSCADGAAMPKAYECVGGLFKDEAIELFQRFYVRGNPKAPVPHREVKEYPS